MAASDFFQFDPNRSDWYIWFDDTTDTKLYLGVGDWPGAWSVNVQKIGDGGVDGETYDSPHDAYDAFNAEVDALEHDDWGHIVTLSITWPDDEEGYCWDSVPVLKADGSSLEVLAGIGLPTPPELRVFDRRQFFYETAERIDSAVDSADFSDMLRDIADLRDWCGDYYDAYGQRGEVDAWSDPLFLAAKRVQTAMEARALRVFSA